MIRTLHLIVLLVSGLLFRCQAEFMHIELSPCANQCLQRTVAAWGCEVSDAHAICPNEHIAQSLTDCLHRNCTVQEYLATTRVWAASCDLEDEYIGNWILIPTLTLASIVTIAIVLRFVTKIWIIRSGLQADDYCLALCFLVNFIFVHLLVTIVQNGFGNHVYQLRDGAVEIILKKLWYNSITYFVILGLVKTTILIFYLRIFPYRRFRQWIWALIAFVGIATTIMVLQSIFRCRPVAYAWDRDRGGTCISHSGQMYGSSALVILSDFLIILSPIPLIKKLNLNTKKKIGVILMFALGSFGCIVSIVRLYTLVAYDSTLDPTYDFVSAIAWSAVEVQIPIVTICFPSLRQLYAHYYPTKQQTTTDESADQNTPRRKYGSWLSTLPTCRTVTVDETHLRPVKTCEMILYDMGGILAMEDGTGGCRYEGKGHDCGGGSDVLEVVSTREGVREIEESSTTPPT